MEQGWFYYWYELRQALQCLHHAHEYCPLLIIHVKMKSFFFICRFMFRRRRKGNRGEDGRRHRGSSSTPSSSPSSTRPSVALLGRRPWWAAASSGGVLQRTAPRLAWCSQPSFRLGPWHQWEVPSSMSSSRAGRRLLWHGRVHQTEVSHRQSQPHTKLVLLVCSAQVSPTCHFGWAPSSSFLESNRLDQYLPCASWNMMLSLLAFSFLFSLLFRKWRLLVPVAGSEVILGIIWSKFQYPTTSIMLLDFIITRTRYVNVYILCVLCLLVQ